MIGIFIMCFGKIILIIIIDNKMWDPKTLVNMTDARVTEEYEIKFEESLKNKTEDNLWKKLKEYYALCCMNDECFLSLSLSH